MNMNDGIIQRETFGDTYTFAPNYRHVNDVDMHFVDEGNGEPVVLLHGDPAWGYLWRNIITLVVHDWGGPVGLGFAIRHPDRIKRLVISNTWASARWPGAPFPRLIEMIRSSGGEKFVLEKNGYLERALIGTTRHVEWLSGPVMDAYRAPFPTPETRVAMLCWSRDIPVAEADPSYPEMQRIEDSLTLFATTPTLIVWGMLDPVLPDSVLRWWQDVYPHAIIHEIEDASHFLQEDAPQQIGGYIRDFMAANP